MANNAVKTLYIVRRNKAFRQTEKTIHKNIHIHYTQIAQKSQGYFY